MLWSGWFFFLPYLSRGRGERSAGHLFGAGGRVARRYSSPRRAPHPVLLSDTWPTDPPWRGREALKAFPKSAKTEPAHPRDPCENAGDRTEHHDETEPAD